MLEADVTPSSVSGVAALLVLTIARLPSAFLTSQVQLEPKLFTAESVNFAFKIHQMSQMLH